MQDVIRGRRVAKIGYLGKSSLNRIELNIFFNLLGFLKKIQTKQKKNGKNYGYSQATLLIRDLMMLHNR